MPFDKAINYEIFSTPAGTFEKFIPFKYHILW